MCEVYRIFSKEWSHTHDFSDNAMIELFNHESYGTKLSEKNGFALGKKWMNVTVAAWKEDIQAGLLFKIELLNNPTFPKWWIESVLSKIIIPMSNEHFSQHHSYFRRSIKSG